MTSYLVARTPPPPDDIGEPIAGAHEAEDGHSRWRAPVLEHGQRDHGHVICGSP